MKVVILAGGTGSRLYEETKTKPKPLVEIGGMPILWHIIKYYLSSGFNDFIVCAGYKGDMIVNFFDTQFTSMQNILNFGFTQSVVFKDERCKVTVADTGYETMTGGRLKRIANMLNNERFLVTYGDTLSNIDIKQSINFHIKQNVKATLTSIHPTSRYGVLDLDSENNKVRDFKEKPIDKTRWVNAGYYIFENEILDLIKGDETVLENGLLELLIKQKQLAAYKHTGFWESMETYKDKLHLESLWESGSAPWKIWDDTVGLGKVL